MVFFRWRFSLFAFCPSLLLPKQHKYCDVMQHHFHCLGFAASWENLFFDHLIVYKIECVHQKTTKRCSGICFRIWSHQNFLSLSPSLTTIKKRELITWWLCSLFSSPLDLILDSQKWVVSAVKINYPKKTWISSSLTRDTTKPPSRNGTKDSR